MSAIEILAPVAPWQHVRPMGEDMVATELVLAANHRLRPQDIGAAAGAGHAQLSVRRRPRVAIQPTGTELVAPGSDLRPGDIVEYNSLVIGAMVEEWGGLPTRLPPLADDYRAIRDRCQAVARTHDLVIINAGSSAGSEDFTAHIVAELGQVLVHGIAVRPGHPVILGTVNIPEETPASAPELLGESAAPPNTPHASRLTSRIVPVIGLPGYPVSAAMTCELLVKPTLARWLGQPDEERPTLQATLTRKVVSPEGDEEFLRVTVGQVGERVVATPLPGGSGVLMSLVRADGLVRIPRGQQGFEPGAPVTVHLLRPADTVRRTLVSIGSHDLTLDLLADELGRRYPGRGLSSANVGSLGGLLALSRDEAHFAGSHLLDEETGEYNVTYIRRLLGGTPVVLIGCVQRVQGLIVPRRNPKGIRTLADLVRPDVVFINRQRGAGTRVLLDYRLRQQSIDPRDPGLRAPGVHPFGGGGGGRIGRGRLRHGHPGRRACAWSRLRAPGPGTVRSGDTGPLLRQPAHGAAAGHPPRSGLCGAGRGIGRLRNATDGARAGRDRVTGEEDGPRYGGGVAVPAVCAADRPGHAVGRIGAPDRGAFAQPAGRRGLSGGALA